MKIDSFSQTQLILGLRLSQVVLYQYSMLNGTLIKALFPLIKQKASGTTVYQKCSIGYWHNCSRKIEIACGAAFSPRRVLKRSFSSTIHIF
uniref:Uncharacterized protein n=1 Tax=Rhizophora mucronata TaxID=61149 RepID=A0A2P2JDR8_RHIMU